MAGATTNTRRVALALALGLSTTTAGCATYDKAVTVVDWTGGALHASAEVLRAVGEDFADIWGASFGKVTDAVGLVPPAPEEKEAAAPAPEPAE